jgi:type II secretory pathway pseudopilin PulG
MWRSFSTRFAGLCILLAGVWAGIIPFVGPYFHFTLGPDKTWTYTTGRLWLDILPAAAAVLGGLLLLSAGPWPTGRFGALLALAAGVWLVVGPDISHVWHAGGQQGLAHGSAAARIAEPLALHTGVGVIIAALAAYALPGFLRPRHLAVERDAALAGTGAAVGAAEARHRDRVAARRGVGGPVAGREAAAAAPAAAPAGAAAAPVDPAANPGGTAAAPVDPAANPGGAAAAPVDPAANPGGGAAAPVDPAANPGGTAAAPVDPATTRQPLGVGAGPQQPAQGVTRRRGLFSRR